MTACKNGEVHYWTRRANGFQPTLLLDIKRNLIGVVRDVPHDVAASSRVERLCLSPCSNHLIVWFNNGKVWYLSMAGALSEKPPPNTTLHLVCAKKGVTCLAWAGHVSAFSAEFLLGTMDGMVLDVVVDHGVQGQTDVWEFFAARSDWSIAGMGRAHKPTITLRTAWEVGASRPPSKDGSMFEIFQDLKANKIHDAIFRKSCAGPIKPVLDIVIKPLQEGVLVVVAYEDSVDVFEGPSPFVSFGGREGFHRQLDPHDGISLSALRSSVLESQVSLKLYLWQHISYRLRESAPRNLPPVGRMPM